MIRVGVRPGRLGRSSTTYEVAVFTEVEPDPSAHTVEKAFASCQAHRASAVLAIGGGSTIDVAKAVGILVTNGDATQS